MVSPRSGSEIPTGAHPGNTGGKKGRSGRKPNEFKALMQELASSPDAEKTLRAIIKDKKHPKAIEAIKHVTEHGYGKARQPLELEADDSLAALILQAAGVKVPD